MGKISDALQNSAGTIPAIQTRIDNLEDRRPILDISKRWADTTSANPTAANGQIAIVNALIGNAQHTRPIDILEVHVSGEVGYSAHFLVQINSSSGNVLSAVVIPIYVNEVDGLSSNTISVLRRVSDDEQVVILHLTCISTLKQGTILQLLMLSILIFGLLLYLKTMSPISIRLMTGV